MPITIKLKFPAGRYHATPWGRHVNEGVAEWPPSPWRLLRALIAVWKRTCPDLNDEQVKRALTALLAPPRFYLPSHRVAHTRHYMPWEKKGPSDRTLVFDTFVSVSRLDAVLVQWPNANLDANELDDLRKMLGNLTSLGRAESWVHAELTNETAEWNSVPTETALDPVPVFCPDPATAFQGEHYPTHDPNKLARGKVNPKDFLFDCPRWHLCLDTETIHDKKWPSVPGATWVNYVRPLDTIAPALKRADALALSPGARPTVARFVLDGPVLPLVQDTLPLAERVRAALMSQYKHVKLRSMFGSSLPAVPPRVASRVFSGKDELGQPLKDNHQHAFFLPTDDDNDGHIDHVTVYAAPGFDVLECQALTRLRELWVREDDSLPGLRFRLVGLGQPPDFKAAALGPAQVWVSATPFLATRMPKLRGRKKDPPHLCGRPNERAFAAEVLREQIRMRSLPEPVAITPLPDHRMGPRQLRPIQFKRFRHKPGDDGSRSSGAFQIVFPHPVSGPICLGHSCHFGLGLFIPGNEKEASMP